MIIIGDNAVCSGLIHHLLIKIAFRELKLFTSIADGTLHDIPLALAAELPFFVVNFLSDNIVNPPLLISQRTFINLKISHELSLKIA